MSLNMSGAVKKKPTKKVSTSLVPISTSIPTLKTDCFARSPSQTLLCFSPKYDSFHQSSELFMSDSDSFLFRRRYRIICSCLRYTAEEDTQARCSPRVQSRRHRRIHYWKSVRRYSDLLLPANSGSFQLPAGKLHHFPA